MECLSKIIISHDWYLQIPKEVTYLYRERDWGLPFIDAFPQPSNWGGRDCRMISPFLAGADAGSTGLLRTLLRRPQQARG